MVSTHLQNFIGSFPLVFGNKKFKHVLKFFHHPAIPLFWLEKTFVLGRPPKTFKNRRQKLGLQVSYLRLPGGATYPTPGPNGCARLVHGHAKASTRFLRHWHLFSLDFGVVTHEVEDFNLTMLGFFHV